jgi:opacity protein-like surface antigen
MSIASRKAQAIGVAATLACVAAFAGAAASAAEQVPFVGCASDGQTGPVPAPNGAPKTFAIDAAAASQLAYYQAEDSFGVLAPRGWNCFYVYGSSGSSLMVSPSPLGGAFDARLSDAGVIATLYIGSTSGRFEVARYSARLFAKQEQKFIAGVIAEGIEPKKNFPFGPYPADKLTYKKPLLVEFETPGNRDGLGTSDRLQKNAQAILGMASLKATSFGPDFFLLTVRLAANQAGLETTIVAQAE